MAVNWPELQISDFASVKGGKRLPKGSSLADYRTPHPYIRVVDILNNRVSDASIMYLTPQIQSQIRRYIVNTNDVCLAIVGHSIGLVFFVGKEWDGANLTENAARITDFNGVHSKYLFYYLRSPHGQHEIKARTVGSAQRKLPLYSIRGMKMPIPPLHEQHAIAHMLGALDDKIELNHQMNQTLEAIARAIFKSWFVDFDPVWAKMDGERPYGMDAEIATLFPDAFLDSELGPIPKGWKVKDLPEALEVNPHRSLSKGELAPYLAMADMPTSSALPQSWGIREFNSGMRFINGDVLVARITPCLENGKTAFVSFLHEGEIGWGSTEYIVFRSKAPLPLEYAYFLARTPEFRSHSIANMTGTSGRQRVPKDCFDHYPVVVPSEQVAARFGEIAGNVVAMMKQNNEQSHTLAELRDTLLPKLMSGQLRVPDAEEFAGKSQ